MPTAYHNSLLASKILRVNFITVKVVKVVNSGIAEIITSIFFYINLIKII